jgi:hypothetical protein
MSPRPHLLAVVLLVASGAIALAGGGATLVVCAPGYPGSTAEAQGAMDGFAAAAGDAAGWPAGELRAAYFETERGGLDRLAQGDAALALVPLAFFLEHRETLRLAPRLQAVMAGGQAAEPWTLVEGKGKVARSADLDGFEIISLAGWSPRFVCGPALAGFGLPASVRITFSGAVLSALRRTAAGEMVAVLLDGPQAAALPTLPFAASLDAVHRSAPLPVSVLCLVGSRLPAARAKALLAALPKLGATEPGAAALAGLHLSGFVPADEPALAAARAAFAKAGQPR